MGTQRHRSRFHTGPSGAPLSRALQGSSDDELSTNLRYAQRVRRFFAASVAAFRGVCRPPGRQEARRSKETHEHMFFHAYYFNHPFVCRWAFLWAPNAWASAYRCQETTKDIPGRRRIFSRKRTSSRRTRNVLQRQLTIPLHFQLHRQPPHRPRVPFRLFIFQRQRVIWAAPHRHRVPLRLFIFQEIAASSDKISSASRVISAAPPRHRVRS